MVRKRKKLNLPSPEPRLPHPEAGLPPAEDVLPEAEGGLPNPETDLPDVEDGLPNPEMSLLGKKVLRKNKPLEEDAFREGGQRKNRF